ncbi:hypothetical protein DXV75_00695 [Alteromonas aestuariivivens]|uniref:Peptidase n=1 Tax=Alteromonas aestuariivivens TaxID=1938339 RepID=A0A3D8MFN1_9ALTE|nr:SapC family protein [Alteromonas aestuariivivens]RDV29018.1 hypothetical protein DXV75_00695 [Alteromonas aestuariivivens]
MSDNSTLTPLNSEQHRNLGLLEDKSYAHSAHSGAVAIAFSELASLSGCMPIVALKGTDNLPPALSALLGFGPAQNLFHHSGQWMGHAVPLTIQSYPFHFTTRQQHTLLLIDENAGCINSAGAPLFGSDGSAMPMLKGYQEKIAQLSGGLKMSAAFIAELQKLDLLSPISVTCTGADGETHTLEGLLSINEPRFQQLPAETLVSLHESGMLMGIYAMMLSLRQFNRLVQLSQNTASPVKKISIRKN